MSTLRNRHQESQITLKRLTLVSVVFVSLYILLAVRLYQLQITHHDYYQKMANKNKSREVHLAPPRADIVDRHQKPLAMYQTKYMVSVEKDEYDAIVKQLETLGITLGSLSQEITAEQYAYLYNHPVKGLTVRSEAQRYYPLGSATAHLIGYTGKLEKAHLFQNPPLEGKSGAELFYNGELMGQIGIEKQYVNAKGNLFHSEQMVAPRRSLPLQLTIDSQLQDFVYHLMLGHAGAVIVLNPKNGELLAAISSPSFDPNTLSSHTFHSRLDLEDKPMFNRLSQGLYSPGSVIKPFVALQALDEGKITPQETIEDPGFYKLNEHSRVFHDHKRNGHGIVNLHKALAMSCDTYFYHLSQRLGIDTLVSYLKHYHFGEKTDLPMMSENSGIVPDEIYRHKHYKHWYAGQTLITGIGQGDVLVSPLQLARATMLLANDGFDYPLHYVVEEITPVEQTIVSNIKHRKAVIDALEVVTTHGTARRIGPKRYPLAGKTGTIQVVSLEDQAQYKSLPKHYKDHHMFIGFAPSYDASIAIVVIIEHQHEATNIAAQILDWCDENGYILEADMNKQ